MEEQMSRREMFGYSAAAIGGVTALTVGAQAGTDEHQEHSQPEAGSSHPEPDLLLVGELQRRPATCQTAPRRNARGRIIVPSWSRPAALHGRSSVASRVFL